MPWRFLQTTCGTDRRIVKHLLHRCSGLVVALTTSASGQVLYDVPFAAPFQTYGQPVATDLGGIPRMGPSSLFAVAPTTVESYGSFNDGAAKFMTSGPSFLSQMRFSIMGPDGVGIKAPGYSLDFDLIIDNLGGPEDEFTIFFDGPQSNRFSFRGDGLIQYSHQPNFIGMFNEDEPIHVHVDFFGDDDLWTIIVNGRTLYSGSIFFDYEELSSIRLSISDTLAFDSVVYVDNVVIAAVPGPATILLIPLVLHGVPRRRRMY